MTHLSRRSSFALFVVVVLTLFSPFSNQSSAAETAFEVKVTGKGPAMIFIPGLACSGEVWDDAVAHFSKDHECHVLTLPGFAGVAPAKEKGPFLEPVGKSVAEYIREKKLDKPVIVGHSLGGFLALWLGAKEPELVGPIVSIDGLPCLGGVSGRQVDKAKLKADAEQLEKQMAAQPREAFLARQKAMLSMWLSDPKRLEKAQKWGETSDQATVARAISELFGTDLRDDLSAIKTPVLLLGPFHPDIARFTGMTLEQVTKRYQEQVAKAPHAKVAIAENAKHFIMYDAPEWTWKQMDEFLAAK